MHKSKNTGSRVLSGRHRGAMGTPLIATFSGTLDNRLTRYNILNIFPQASEPTAPSSGVIRTRNGFPKNSRNRHHVPDRGKGPRDRSNSSSLCF